MEIKVTIDDSGLKEMIRKLQDRLGNLMPLMKQIGETVRSSVVKNFEVGGRPRWIPSKKKTGLTLVNRGRLRNSTFFKAYASKVEVGTNVAYGAIHQFGGKTGPHTIVPVNKKALFWPGARHPVKSVKHPGSTIPARPFLAVQNEDWTEIKRLAGEHLVKNQ